MTAPEQALSAATLRILRALIRILMRFGMPFEGFSELAKRIYIEVAAEDFAIDGRKQSISRISTLTGIYRREVSRILALPPVSDTEITARHNRASRVIGGWLQDSAYSTSKGKARVLTFTGDEPSFTHLVGKYSGDIPARAILDELIRVGAVEQDKHGKVHLLSRAYVPQHGEDDMLSILGVDTADFLSTIDYNLQQAGTDSRLQLKVVYDNLPAESVAEFKALAGERGHDLLEEFNTWLAKRDRDTNPDSNGTGRVRAGLGIYYFEDSNPEETDNDLLIEK